MSEPGTAVPHTLGDGPLASMVPLLRSRLARHDPQRLGATSADAAPSAPSRRAAVALVLFDHQFRQDPMGGHSPAFLMIKRSPRGPFPGQWALPGGRLADGEGDVAAAVRETAEEVGVELGEGEILGALDDVPTAGTTVIAPIVFASARPLRFLRDPREVHSLHPIRLSRLVARGVPRWRQRPEGPPLLQMPLRRDMVVHAPTGAILWQFAQIALRGIPQDVAELAQPALLETSVPRVS